jgi:hypothetical protein
MQMDKAMPVEETIAPVATAHAAPLPYASPAEHLQDLLLRHDWLLSRELARAHARKSHDGLGFVAISEREVRQLLDAHPFADSKSELAIETMRIELELRDLSQRIDARVEQSRLHGVRLPLVELARRFALEPREVDFLVAAVACDFDRRYERINGYLHDDVSRKLASTGLALSLYCESAAEQLSARELLGKQGRLRHFKLLEVIEDGAPTPWLSRLIRLDERVTAFLVGSDATDPRIAPYVTMLENVGALREDQDEAVARTARWLAGLASNKKPLVYLQSARHAGADGLVGQIAGRLGVPIIAVDAELLIDSDIDFEQTLFLLFREGILNLAAIYLRNIDRALEQQGGGARYRALLRCIGELGGIVFASGEVAWCWQLPAEPTDLRVIEVHPGSFAEQLRVWKSVSGSAFSDEQLQRLISIQPLPVGAIKDVWRLAQSFVAANEGRRDEQPTLEQVQQACRFRSGAPVSSLARKLDPKHRWADLVLPQAQLEQLTAICSQAKHSSIVYGNWRFDRKLSVGRGLNALFSGQPGTGKTMAAEVLAADLGVEILKIDLSQIVSKYIGETEKNLRQLFDQATHANAILFFDEADALLGKRSAVKDAHDRYANTETAYLLQKMEEYPGITILATNLRQNMDEAFTRRMRFIVDFPFPEETDRLRIWQSVWPTEVPLAQDVDFPALARQFRLSGGSIRNIALSAAFLAAEQATPLTMSHLLLATKRELQKMGRLVNEVELRHPEQRLRVGAHS